jgi:hypothetical protein
MPDVVYQVRRKMRNQSFADFQCQLDQERSELKTGVFDAAYHRILECRQRRLATVCHRTLSEDARLSQLVSLEHSQESAQIIAHAYESYRKVRFADGNHSTPTAPLPRCTTS